MISIGDKDLCPMCGPTSAERHPGRPEVTRCSNCKEWLRSRPWWFDTVSDRDVFGTPRYYLKGGSGR